MGKANIKVSKGLNWLINPKEILPALARSNDLALDMMVPHIIKDTEPFVPKNTGMLRESAYDDIDIKSHGAYSDAQLTIHYSRPIQHVGKNGRVYTKEGAPMLYKGLNPITGAPIKKWTTEGTDAQWVERSIEVNSAKWKDQFGKEYVQIFRKEMKM